MARKTYGQYCGLAKALDHIGERWTLLIVRELLVAPRRYGEIREALPGIATNLLAERLRDLGKDGIIVRGESGAYELTELGAELEPAIAALVRWGGRWMGRRSSRETFRPAWLVVALRALLPRRRTVCVQLRVSGETVHLDRKGIGLGPLAKPDATVRGRPEEILAVAAGRAQSSILDVAGSRTAVRAALQPARSEGR